MYMYMYITCNIGQPYCSTTAVLWYVTNYLCCFGVAVAISPWQRRHDNQYLTIDESGLSVRGVVQCVRVDGINR